MEQFWYDKEKDDCFSFNYGGCQGNGNKFDTLTFCENIQKQKNWVPGSPAYNIEVGDWTKYHIDKGKMDKQNKNTFIQNIYKKSEKKETSVPGVGRYEIDKQWKNSSKVSLSKTSYKNTEIKHTFPTHEI